MLTTREQVLAAIDELQVWFARKPYGWREQATPGQLQQWEDREREHELLCDRLELLTGN